MRMRALGALLTAATAALATAAPASASASALTAPARPAEGRVLGLGLPGAIAGRYLVTLKNGAVSVASVGLGGATVLARTGSTVAAAMTPAQARRLAADPTVQYVEQDRMVHITATTQRNPGWDLDRIDQRTVAASKSYTAMDDGDSVHAYVIDTGVRISHSQFGGRASYGYDFVDNDTTAQDCNGHGTHVAGTIGGATYGVAKKVKIVAVRVLDCDGEGDLYSVIEGVNWVTSHAVRPAVANMSMGGDYSASLQSAVQRSINAGITYAVAAGNDDVNASTESPAGLSAAITVGATDSRDRRASFSNYGSVLDLFAPGVNIRSAWAASNTATAVLSGTSMASPHVAGAAALVLDAYPADTPAQVRAYLVAHATTGKVIDAHGSPNRMLFVPAPAGPPSIATTRVSASLLRPFTGQLSLAGSRRGTWSIASGTLPAGLRLSASGVVSGTPTDPGTSTVVVRFVDYVPNTATRTVTFTVAATTPVIATTSLPAATAGSAYAEKLTVTDDRDGVWAVTDGALPDGLTLSDDGLLDGTPATTGDATFTIQFTDPWGNTTTSTYTLTVQD
jgi:subtilisin family serine protease